MSSVPRNLDGQVLASMTIESASPHLTSMIPGNTREKRLRVRTKQTASIARQLTNPKRQRNGAKAPPIALAIMAKSI